MNWNAAIAVGTFLNFGGIVVIIFRAGMLVQRVTDLEHQVRTIDREGCGAATRLHNIKPTI